jgi:hypothetical protein
MTIRRATVALVAAGSVAVPPPARADEPPPASPQEEYDLHFIGFDDFGLVDPETGVFHKMTEAYEGKYKKPIGGADFYRTVGREDLAQEYLEREQRRNALMIAGGAVALGSLVASSIIAANGFSSSSCDVTSPSFAQCSDAEASRASTGVLAAAAVGISGLLVGGGLFLAGAATNPNPLDASRMRELADQYNRQLKQRLDVSLLPLASPDRAGLALNLRF